jgi:post-segregation antitoxin (ccd killing protein)
MHCRLKGRRKLDADVSGAISASGISEQVQEIRLDRWTENNRCKAISLKGRELLL